MRYLLALIFLLGLSISADAHKLDIAHVHCTTSIANVKSNLVVQGTIVVGPKVKLPNSAIVNQTAVWQGQTYTYNPKTRKIVVRAKDDYKHKLPALTIVKVEKGKVTFSFVDYGKTKAVLFKKNIKKKTRPKK